MTTPMLEKLARDLARHRYHNTPDQEWLDRYVDADWPNRIDEARVVVMGLRKPDEDMLSAGYDAQSTAIEHHVLGADAIWEAMIDHILEGETK